MTSDDSLISSEGDYVLANEGSAYIVYLKNGGESALDLANSEGEFEVHWFNPRKGGALQQGKVKSISGPGEQLLGMPPVRKERDKDWVVLIRKI